MAEPVSAIVTAGLHVVRTAADAARRFSWPVALAPVFLLLTAHALAQALPDPTRPPDALNPVIAAGTAESGPVLQSVLISRGRRVAIISGEEVRQNGKFREWQVVRIGDTEVVLRHGKDVQKLKLFPGR